MHLYCWTLSLLDWLSHPGPYFSGHDYIAVDVDEFGRGTLRCKRCGHLSKSW